LNYKYYQNESYEDFSSGRVIYHKSGMTNYPVRLAGEIFKRCLEYIEKPSDIVLYDPCCGGGYILTVLGYLNHQIIKQIIGSDINEESIVLAKKNLSLLTQQGLLSRRQQIEELVDKYNKKSHMDALESLSRLMDILKQRRIDPAINCFSADVLDNNSLSGANFKADIVFTDVPYNKLTSWKGNGQNSVEVLLDRITSVLHSHSVIAISTDKSQKIKNEKFQRLKKFNVGKRRIEILRLKTV